MKLSAATPSPVIATRTWPVRCRSDLVHADANPHSSTMRTISDTVSVRLYHLSDSDDGGSASTLFYGPLAQAMAIGSAQPAELQERLFLATENDVVAFLDLVAD
jgi:hypothetical protein